MKVKVMHSVTELERMKPFYVDKLLWGTKNSPKTYGYLGFVPDDGFYLKMVCEEQEPFRTFTRDMEPVYKDSAMEAFFLFRAKTGFDETPIYLNFEVNANGAMLAAYGRERKYRTCFDNDDYREIGCHAEILKESWQFSLRIPIKILTRIYGSLNLKEGSVFSCNFYKISEASKIEHYASYALVDTEMPDFHLPEFFETAVIEK